MNSLATTATSARRPRRLLMVGTGVFLGLAAVGALAHYTGMPWVMGSFGASCVLLFGFPEAPFSRPRNVLGGHLIASAIGLAVLHLAGDAWYAMALAGALAATLMVATDTVHPPAGSNPVIIFLYQPDWSFLLLPTLAGASLLVVIALAHRYLWGPRR
ncbi:HPP family protein [Pseudomonas sp. RW407]|uniref:HPP family protein n=1 Tax=Pseudomonas sp. RW407 TaxID=2202894 RepID=UPI000D6FF0CE|nr:HPP family protein [Pseudomonas sp. RW407]PWU30662.1 HPP family protein [Pseudomonas sp. RW407]